jgi:integrase
VGSSHAVKESKEMARTIRHGLRKVCRHQPSAWAKCSHPWHFSFKWAGQRYRFSLDRVLPEPVRLKGEAETAANRIRAEIQGGTFRLPTETITVTVTAASAPGEPLVEPAGPTLRAYVAMWLETLPARVKPTTVEFYQDTVDRVVLPAFGDRVLADLEVSDAEQLAASLVAKGQARSGIRGVLRTLSAILSHAAASPKKTGLKANPLLGGRMGSFAAQARDAAEPDPFTTAEATRLLNVARQHRRRAELWLTFFQTALCTGLRLGELLGLDWIDVDIKGRTITVRQNWTRASRRTGKAGTPKNGKARIVDLSTPAAAQLETFRRLQLAAALKLGERLPAPVFANELGERLDGRNVTRVLHALCAAAKVRKRGVHTCRDTFASQLLSLGKPPIYVSTQLGHSTPAITLKVYARWIPREDGRRGVDDLPDFARGTQ